MDPELRRRSVAAIADLDVEGIAIGGLSVGESKAEMAATLEAVAESLGDDPRARYLMGVGSPLDFFVAVERGVDLFDSVLPTRVARNGQLWTSEGRLNLRNARLLDDPARWTGMPLRNLAKPLARLTCALLPGRGSCSPIASRRSTTSPILWT